MCPLDFLSIPTMPRHFPNSLTLLPVYKEKEKNFTQMILEKRCTHFIHTSTGITVAVLELNGRTVKSSLTSKHLLQSASDNINRSLNRQVTF